MSSKPLQTQSLLDLIDLFERSGQPIADGDGQRLRGVPGWSVLGRTSLTPKLLEQWTDCVGYAGSYPASLADDLVQADLTEDDQADRYRYRCPETFRWRFVPAAEVAVYSVRPTALLNIIADLLGIAQGMASAEIDRPPVGSSMHNRLRAVFCFLALAFPLRSCARTSVRTWRRQTPAQADFETDLTNSQQPEGVHRECQTSKSRPIGRTLGSQRSHA